MYLLLPCHIFQSGMIQNGREGIFIEPHGTGILTNATFGPHNLASCGLIQAPPMDLGQLSHRYLILFEKDQIQQLSCSLQSVTY
jgi:hypothetical protein